MKININRIFLLIVIFSLALAGCKSSQTIPPTPTVDTAATQTQIAERTIAAVTVDAAMTESARIDTPIVVEPSATDQPTEKPTSPPTEPVVIRNTSTPTSSATPEPTSTTILPTITSAPVEYKCNLVRTEPIYKAVLDRGEAFDVHWTLENSGTETWYHESVTGRYRNGYELQRYQSSFDLNYAVEPRHTYEVVIEMKAPYEPGEYSAIWILEHKAEAFCWFSVDIVVK
jgi:hypothetical protein